MAGEGNASVWDIIEKGRRFVQVRKKEQYQNKRQHHNRDQYHDKTHKGFRLRRFLAVCLSLVFMVSLLGGCGRSAQETDKNGVRADDSGNMAGEDGGQQAGFSKDGTAMGRYLEESLELKEGLSGYRNQIFKLADGRLMITDLEKQMLVSEDGGKTWTGEHSEPVEALLAAEANICGYAVGGDGLMAVLYEKYIKAPANSAEGESGEQGEGDAEAAAASVAFTGGDYEVGDRLEKGILIIKPDGTQVEADLSVMEEEGGAEHVWVSDSGRIFATTDGDTLYEIMPDGESKAFLTLEGAPQLMQFQGNILIADGYDYDTLVIYDMENGTYIEDEALEDFVQEYYQDKSFNGGSWYDLYFFPGEEGVLYLAGKSGLYRHVIGGAVMEQVIDGSLSSLGSPGHRLLGMTVLEGNEFVAVFGDAKIVRYVYNPDVPAVPAERIKAYSLKESNALRQAIFQYQAADPSVYVEYEIGMEDGSSVTRDDALKKLNTQIMAGEGPDLIILDDMPIDSYIEKGLLRDLAPVVEGMDGDAALFSNIVDAFRKDGGLFCLPVGICLPVIAGKAADIDKMTDLSGIADGIEKIRQENPGEDILRTCSEKGIMKKFTFVCAPAWQAQDGTVRRDALAEFFEQTKRIYGAQMDGLAREKIREYEKRQEENLMYYGEMEEDGKYFAHGVNELNYMWGSTKLMLGSVDYTYAYAELTSVLRTPGYEEDIFRPMYGQCTDVFTAETLVGISAASQNAERAEELFKILMGPEGLCDNGLPINRVALEDSLFPEDYVSEDDAYSGLAMSDEEGHVLSFTVYWYGEEHAGLLRDWISAAKIPYVRDSVLEEAVYKAGVAYMRGETDLEEAVSDVEESMAIYLAE